MDDKKTVVEEAKERYERAKSAYNSSRMLAIEDTRFALGDSDNGWQWPDAIRRGRMADQKVCLTVNLTAQHCNQIINNMRQNRPQCRVLPVDNGADKKTAEIIGGLIRNIQTSSNADDAHDVAAEHCTYGGEGYWRVYTEYESETSFKQCIKIGALPNPLLVYIDDNAKALDKSDAEWGFIFEDISKEQCKRDHPNVDPASWVEDGNKGWVTKDTVRRAEYFYCVYTPDTALLLQDGSEEGREVLKSDIRADQFKMIEPLIIDQRPTMQKRWKWCKLLGGEDKPLVEKDWPGSYLPIISVIGKEVNVNGEIVRKGIVRDLKDPARMVNFSYSEAIQTVALQNKVPYIAAAEAIEGYEDVWQGANTTNLGYLPFNQFDENGNKLDRPDRQQPSVMPAAQVQMLQLSTEQMRAASGQQNANFGIKSEAVSGVGIRRLKEQGEVATFHFPDNQVRGLRYEAMILIDLIPKIYDTKRVVRILGLDGKDEQAILNPDMEQPFAEATTAEDVQKIFNPGVGRYDVVIDTGPSYQTQRQEAQVVMGDIAAKDPNFLNVAGDIYWRTQDFPGSEQLAKRYEKVVPPELQEKKGQPKVPPEIQQQMAQMGQQIQVMEQAGTQLQHKVAELEEDKENKSKELSIKAYDAKTKRLQVLGATITPEYIADLVNQTVAHALTMPEPMPQEPMQEALEDPLSTHLPPPGEEEQPMQPPDGGFFTPPEQQ
jgi:hypothetical protein